MAVDMSRLTEVLTRYRELGIAEQLDYEKLCLYSIITHSTAIEGSTVTEIENQLLFDEGISPNRPIAEVRMSLNLKQAYERGLQAARAHEEITVALLCELRTPAPNTAPCRVHSAAHPAIFASSTSVPAGAVKAISPGRRSLPGCRRSAAG